MLFVFRFARTHTVPFSFHSYTTPDEALGCQAIRFIDITPSAHGRRFFLLPAFSFFFSRFDTYREDRVGAR